MYVHPDLSMIPCKLLPAVALLFSLIAYFLTLSLWFAWNPCWSGVLYGFPRTFKSHLCYSCIRRGWARSVVFVLCSLLLSSPPPPLISLWTSQWWAALNSDFSPSGAMYPGIPGVGNGLYTSLCLSFLRHCQAASIAAVLLLFSALYTRGFSVSVVSQHLLFFLRQEGFTV